MQSIIINSGSINQNLVKGVSALNRNEHLDCYITNTVQQFSLKSKQQLLCLLYQTQGFTSFDIHIQSPQDLKNQMKKERGNQIVYSSLDYPSLQEKKERMINCYESSIAFLIALYHKAIKRNEKVTASKWKDELSKYTGLNKKNQIFKQYIEEQTLKQESLQYFGTLDGESDPRAVDLILEKEILDESYVFVGMRTHYPKGYGRIGGMIDQKDKEIAESFGLSKSQSSLISALREGIEESSGSEENDEEIAAKIVYSKETHNNKEYMTAALGEYKIGVLCNQKPKIYIENPQEEGYMPSDFRGPTSTIARKGIVLSGSTTFSSDLGKGSKWVKKQSIKNINWTMNHHKELY